MKLYKPEVIKDEDVEAAVEDFITSLHIEDITTDIFPSLETIRDRNEVSTIESLSLTDEVKMLEASCSTEEFELMGFTDGLL